MAGTAPAMVGGHYKKAAGYEVGGRYTGTKKAAGLRGLRPALQVVLGLEAKSRGLHGSSTGLSQIVESPTPS